MSQKRAGGRESQPWKILKNPTSSRYLIAFVEVNLFFIQTKINSAVKWMYTNGTIHQDAWTKLVMKKWAFRRPYCRLHEHVLAFKKRTTGSSRHQCPIPAAKLPLTHYLERILKHLSYSSFFTLSRGSGRVGIWIGSIHIKVQAFILSSGHLFIGVISLLPQTSMVPNR